MIYPDLQTVRIYADTYTRIPVYTALDYEADDMLDLYAAAAGTLFIFSGKRCSELVWPLFHHRFTL